MITGEELLKLCDTHMDDMGVTTVIRKSNKLLSAVRAYVAQEARREAAMAWAEAILARKNALPGSSIRKELYVCNDAAKVYLALRNAATNPEARNG